MENDSATPLSVLLQKMAVKSGLDKKLQEASVLEYWKDVVGEKAARSCTVSRIEHGKITVHCQSPVWRTELMMRKTEIITRLNERVGETIVLDIVFK